jgi:hypothetical protein
VWGQLADPLILLLFLVSLNTQFPSAPDLGAQNFTETAQQKASVILTPLISLILFKEETL